MTKQRRRSPAGMGRGTRRRGRELAMKLLYQAEVGKHSIDDICGGFAEFKRAPEESRQFALRLARGVMGVREDLDGKIGEALTTWKLDRLAAVDTQILRIALYEMLHCDEIPANVSIDEAIELSKVYAGSQTASFVNGVLGALCGKYAGHKLGGGNRRQ